MKKPLILGFVFLAFISGVALWLRSPQRLPVSNTSDAKPLSHVWMEGEKQVVEITAKGGYSPKNILAKANLPTELRIKTQGTFDCSSALRIPSLNYKTNLPASGVTTVEIPAQVSGGTIEGICSMGMYHFEVEFR